MPRVQGCEAVYDVADQWRDRCLLDNKSLLWPDLEEPTWTVENIEAAQAAYRRAPEYGGDSWERLFSEIEREPAPVRRVMADVLVKNIERLLEAFIGNRDLGSDSFMEKWEKQLSDEPPASTESPRM